MIEKCSLGNMNNNMKIIGLILLFCILFIVIIYYFRSTFKKHNDIMERFDTIKATIDQTGGTLNPDGEGNNDIYNGEISMRKCQVYFVGNSEQSVCDTNYNEDPLSTNCKYEFKDGWNEIDTIKNNNNTITVPKKIYNKQYTNIGNIENSKYMTACYKDRDTNGNTKYLYDMRDNVVIYGNGGSVNDETDKNTTLRLNVKEGDKDPMIKSYISKHFGKTGNTTNDNLNMISSICSIGYNDVVKSDLKNFYKFNLEKNENDTWVLNNIKDVVLNETQTEFEGNTPSNFTGSSAYGMYIDELKQLRDGKVRFTVFKSTSIPNKPVKIYKFKYNYICSGKVLEYNSPINDTIIMDNLISGTGSEKSSFTFDVTYDSNVIKHDFWTTSVANVDMKDVFIKKLREAHESSKIPMDEDQIYSTLTSQINEIGVSIGGVNGIEGTGGANGDKNNFHKLITIGEESGKKQIIELKNNNNEKIFNFDKGYKISVVNEEVSKYIGKSGSDPIITENSLLAHYKFDSDYNDSSGNNHHLTNTNTTLVPAFIGNGAYFDRTSDIIRTTNNFPSFNISSARTISCWVKRTNINVNRDFIWGQGNGGFELQFGLTFMGDNTIQFYIWSSTTYYTTTTYTDLSVFYHIVSVINAGSVKVYVNNVEVISGTYPRINIETTPLFIGLQMVNGGSSTNIIDEFRVYNKALTRAEIKLLYNKKDPIQNIQPVNINEDYKYISLHNTGANQTPYTITFPLNTICDILVVGGGGGGDGQIGGGGGGGAVLYAQNIIIQPNTYTINVGKGGAENNNGNNTTAFGATCLGGGSTLRVAWTTPNNGRSGGSGSGGSSGNGGTSTGIGGGVGTSTKGSILVTGTLYNGNSGGNGGERGGEGGVSSGGGGGANQVGKSTTNAVRYNNASNYTAWFNAGADGSGGDGILINITGTDYFWGGGGGGGSFTTLAGMGGKGGGGGGSQSDGATPQLGGSGINNGSSGVSGGKGGDGGANTGGGGGGGGWQNTNGGAGGSGIVIIRYRSSISDIELKDRSNENIKKDGYDTYFDTPNYLGDKNYFTIDKNNKYPSIKIEAYTLRKIIVSSMIFLEKNSSYNLNINLGIDTINEKTIFYEKKFKIIGIDTITIDKNGIYNFKTNKGQGGFYKFSYIAVVLLKEETTITFNISNTAGFNFRNYLYGGSLLYDKIADVNPIFNSVLYNNNTHESLLSIVNYLNTSYDYWGITKMNENRDEIIKDREKRNTVLLKNNKTKNDAYNNVINSIKNSNFSINNSITNKPWFTTANPTLKQNVSPSLIFENYNSVDYITYEKIKGNTNDTPTINNPRGGVGADFTTNFQSNNTIDKATIYVLR
jgi:hypothetical protein